MLVLSIPKQTMRRNNTLIYHYRSGFIVNSLESTIITVIAPRDPRNTTSCDFCEAMIEVMKNVLSPSSAAMISDNEDTNDSQKVLIVECGNIVGQNRELIATLLKMITFAASLYF